MFLQAASTRDKEAKLIRYTIKLADADRHHFAIDCELDHPEADQCLSMSSWIPGSYLLREFARHVVSINAESTGLPIEIEKLDKSRWCCRGATETLTVRTVVYAFDQSVRGAYFDRLRAFFNGTSVFLLPDGRETDEVELTVEAPSNPSSKSWRVATAMQAVAVDERGFGTYRAADYAELIDHPFEISDFASVEFEAAGVPHRLVVAGKFDADLDRVGADLSQLCTNQIDFFGRPAPFSSYTFLGLAVGDGYGGLEHRASSSLIFRRDDLPKPGEPGLPREYQRLLGLASHEYFHSWHVKRSKPEAFMPYRLDRRNHTRLLWVFEGITTYYQDLFLLRSDLIGVEAYLRRLGEQLTRVYRVPGRFKQSLAESSFDAWDALYKPNANSPNAGISYYSKGALVALALDLTLRSADQPRKLDDAVLALWQRYGAQGVGLPEAGFEAIAIELGGPQLSAFFQRAVRATEDLALGDLLARFGLKLQFRQAQGPRDAGGTPLNGAAKRLALGANFRNRADGLELVSVLTGGPAERAGLCPGDLLVAAGGLKLGNGNLGDRLARFEVDEELIVDFFRGDVLSATKLTLETAPLDTCYIEIDAAASTSALALREAWLGTAEH